jgi:hypothetical protein
MARALLPGPAMRKTSRLALVLGTFVVGCGGSPAGGGGNIPDPGPGNAVDNNFGSVEPNDTPAHATPLGTAAGAGVGVWVNGNTTTASDGNDYFVFKSSAQTGQFSFNICWSGGITAMTGTLWKVSNGAQVMPPVHSWMSSSSCLSTHPGDAMLEASTTYLFGIQTTGGGTYSA